MNKNAVKLLIGALRELPVMNKIMDILEKKEFTDPGSPHEFGQIVIGVMSPLTRAMYSFLETEGKEDFERAKGAFIFEGPLPCDGLEVSCLRKITFELNFCPYAKALQKFNEEHPIMLAHTGFVHDFMVVLLSNQIPGGEEIIENFYVVTTDIESHKFDYTQYDGWEEMNLEQLMEISIRGTFLEEIADVLENGQFTDIADSVIEGDLVIREMTLLEKAIFTVINNVLKPLKALGEEHNKLINGENFEVSSGLDISRESFMGGMAEIISISMERSGKKSFKPKDKKHPDFIRVEEIEKEIRTKKQIIEPLRDITWSIIDMGIDPSQKNGYDVTGIRQGFQIVVYNKKEELAEVE